MLAQYKALQKEMMTGKTITAVGSGEVNSMKRVEETFKQREDLFRQSLYAKDPTTYASYADVGQSVTGVAFFTTVTEDE